MAAATRTGVLCEELYDVISARIGPVRVVNPGEAFVGHRVPAASGRDTWEIAQSGEYYATSCPFCDDRRQRLWINHLYGQRSEDEEDRMTWLAVCYNQEACLTGDGPEQAAHRRHLRELLLDRLQDRHAAFELRPGIENAALKAVEPPGDLVRLDELAGQHPAIQFLSGVRGYDAPSLGRHWGVSYCTRAVPQYYPAQGRIIIPVIMDGRWMGWQGRYVGDINFKAAGIQKYWNMPGFPRRRLLYNYDRARRHRVVVLVEGVTSTWGVGDAAVGTFGTMTSFQRDLIVATWAPRRSLCVVMFDPDARDKSDRAVLDLAPAFGKSGGHVVRVDLTPGHDPGSYAYDTNWEIIRGSAAAQGVDIDDYL